MAYHPDVRVACLESFCPHFHILHSKIRHICIDDSEYFFYNYFIIVV